MYILECLVRESPAMHETNQHIAKKTDIEAARDYIFKKLMEMEHLDKFVFYFKTTNKAATLIFDILSNLKQRYNKKTIKFEIQFHKKYLKIDSIFFIMLVYRKM